MNEYQMNEYTGLNDIEETKSSCTWKELFDSIDDLGGAEVDFVRFNPNTSKIEGLMISNGHGMHKYLIPGVIDSYTRTWPEAIIAWLIQGVIVGVLSLPVISLLRWIIGIA